MENLKLEGEILHYIYCKNFGEGDPTLNALDKWAVQQNIDKISFWEQYELLIKKEYVRFLQDEGSVRLTPKGVLHTEKNGYVASSLVSKNRQIRKRLLAALVKHLGSRSATISMDELISGSNLEGHYCCGNVDLLVALGYARWIMPRVSLSINAKVFSKEASLAKTR